MTKVTLDQAIELTDQLSIEDKQRLIERLSRQMQTGADLPLERPPKSLRGIWKGHFPEDFDIDAVLHEIRHEWEQELPEMLEP